MYREYEILYAKTPRNIWLPIEAERTDTKSKKNMNKIRIKINSCPVNTPKALCTSSRCNASNLFPYRLMHPYGPIFDFQQDALKFHSWQEMYCIRFYHDYSNASIWIYAIYLQQMLVTWWKALIVSWFSRNIIQLLSLFLSRWTK